MKKAISFFLLMNLFISINPAFSQTTTDWLLSADGLGPIKIGMTIEQAEKAAQQKFLSDPTLEPLATAYCSYPTLAQGPADVSFTFSKGILYRIFITNPNIKTAEGIHIGSNVQEVKTIYKGKIQILPAMYNHKSASDYHPDKAMLVITPPKSNNRLVLNTDDGKKISLIRVGTASAATDPEGCGMPSGAFTINSTSMKTSNAAKTQPPPRNKRREILK